MSKMVIGVKNLGKRYRISHQSGQMASYRALRDVIAQGANSLAKKLVKPTHKKKVSPTHEEFWALDDISFEIYQGECIGVIGRNGAGKSTLLKVLSRITEPTKGRIHIKGRVASLLEVGTGFHPELTGRENIYLNGAILGMTKLEIKRKFDEIIAFAEIERFLDTPVKHYSSGMYVRLAFAVAAHLEPEILIVDEVLAVGDLAFQKKCLGKMGDVAKNEGRTVIFVSHSIQAIAQLTQRCLLLSQGNIEFDGSTNQAIHQYMLKHRVVGQTPAYYEALQNKESNHVAWAKVHTSEEIGIHSWGEPIVFEFAINVSHPTKSLRFSFQIVNEFQQAICIFWFFEPQSPVFMDSGQKILRCEVPRLRIYMGSYTLRTWFSDRRSETLLENLRDICQFEVSMHAITRNDYEWEANECTYLEEAHWLIG